jgi:hypothetical protein
MDNKGLSGYWDVKYFLAFPQGFLALPRIGGKFQLGGESETDFIKDPGSKIAGDL